MKFPEQVFRAYDIRGIIDKEITPDFMTELGKGLASVLETKKAVIGYDARPSSVLFAPYLIQGLVHEGCDVINLGMVPSEVVIATAALNSIDLACIITASHNPAEYVGVKMFRHASLPILQDNGLAEVKAYMQSGNNSSASSQGSVITHDPWPDYLAYVAKTVKRTNFRPRKVLADAGNGTGGILMNHLVPIFNLDVEAMYFEPDGTYPNHIPNPIIPSSRKEAEKRAKEGNYDLTLLFDGDADRIIFFDENGDYVTSDAAGTLIAEHVIQTEHPGSPVVIDPRRGWTTLDSGNEHNYEVVITKAGSPFVKNAMREHNAFFGYEASAHNFYQDFFYSDCAGLTLGYVLRIMEETGKTLSELVAPYRHNHFMIDEANYHHRNAADAFAQLEAHFKETKIDKLDGLSVISDDWHANLRASNTEPLIRLNLEARDKDTLHSKFLEINKVIEYSGGKPETH